MRRLLLAAATALALVPPAAAKRPAPVTLPLPPERVGGLLAPQAGPPQVLVARGTVDTHWWRTFRNPTLDLLVERALAANNDLAAADATLRQAQEQARATRSGLGPQVDLNYQAQKQKLSRTLSGPLADQFDYNYTLHTAQLTVSYAPDVFGGGRNRVRSARAQAEVAAARLAAARSTVVANLVQAVITHASLQAQLAAGQTVVDNNRRLVALLDRRRQLGDIGEADVSAQQTALASAEAALPAIERQLAHERALILTLLGQPAGSAAPVLPPLDALALPAELPLSLPAQMVVDRPDVRAAEAQMRGAAADLGVAIAARLPSIMLSGSAGGIATSITDLFANGNPFWSLLGSVTQPIFHSGQLLHNKRAAEAALTAAQAQYRSTALQAFVDVDDAITGLRTDAAALDASVRANTAAQRTLTFTRRQIELGASGTLQLLSASAAASQASIALVQAQAARLTDSVLLYQAVGSVPAVDRAP